MKKTLIGFLLLVFALPLMANQPATTRVKEGGDKGRYRVAKNTFTATAANLDSIIVLNEDGVAVETGDFEANRTIFTLQFNTAATVAADSDFDVLWQVTAVQTSLLMTVFPGETGEFDWTTVETDVNSNSLSWTATFDAASYKGMRVRAILTETDGTNDGNDAIEVYLTYPRK